MVRRSLRQACRRYEIRVDTAFAEVVEGCADPARPHGWIDDQMRAAYVQLHHAGFAHSVETWSGGELVGGSTAWLSAGCSRASPCSAGLGTRRRSPSWPSPTACGDDHPRLIDVQWATPHLRSLGVTEIPRRDYLLRLRELLACPPPALFGFSQAQPP